MHGGHTSAIKSILFYLHEDECIDVCMQSAITLARLCSAHLSLLQVTPADAYTMVRVFAAGPIGDDIIAAAEEVATKFRARLASRLEREQLSWSSEAIVGRIVPEILRHAAFSDILVMGRIQAETEFSRSGATILGKVLSNIRSPMLIPGAESAPLDPLGTVMIAWNGSIEAANAVRQNIGLLRMASEVQVVRFGAHEGRPLSDECLLRYLSHHGIPASLEALPAHGLVSDALIDRAWSAHASYVVLGAYSHSRAGEFLFGGVTRHLLNECPVTLLVAR